MDFQLIKHNHQTAKPENNVPENQHTVMTYWAAQLTGVPVTLHQAQALQDEPDDGGDGDGDTGAMSPRGATALATRAAKAGLRKVVSQRFIAARELNGVSQSEAARQMGFANSTQLSLWEKGARLPPIDMMIVASRVYAVSLDYLYGLSDEPERDPRIATRAMLLDRVGAMLERHAEAVVEALLPSCSVDGTNELRATGLVPAAQELGRALGVFRKRNRDAFDELPAGAPLVRAAREAAEATARAAELIERADRRAEYAMQRARAAMVADGRTA